jgi:hypothetical protein
VATPSPVIATDNLKRSIQKFLLYTKIKKREKINQHLINYSVVWRAAFCDLSKVSAPAAFWRPDRNTKSGKSILDREVEHHIF